MEETIPTPQGDIMQYDPQIWAVTDLLIAEDIKPSIHDAVLRTFSPFVGTFMPIGNATPAEPTKEPGTSPLW